MLIDSALRNNFRGLQVTAATAAAPEARLANPFWVRFYDALMDSRMRKAEHEIRKHLHLVPEDVLKRSGLYATLRDSKDFPFVR